MLRTSLLVLSVLALSACATQEETAIPSGGGDCFFASEVDGYSLVDNNTVRVQVSPTRNYLLRTQWNARDLNWTRAIAIRSSTGTICTGNGLGVEIVGGDPRQTYPVSAIEREPDPVPAGS